MKARKTNPGATRNAVPCPWVGNRICQLDPAFVRRFSLAVEVPAPPRRAREQLLSRYSTGLGYPRSCSARSQSRSGSCQRTPCAPRA